VALEQDKFGDKGIEEEAMQHVARINDAIDFDIRTGTEGSLAQGRHESCAHADCGIVLR